MGYTEELLAPELDFELEEGEEVLYDLRPTWVLHGWKLLLGVFGAMLVVGLPLLAYGMLSLRIRRYVITTDRVLIRKGVLNTRIYEFRLDDVYEMRMGDSYRERMASCGHVAFYTEEGVYTITAIRNYKDVAQSVADVVFEAPESEASQKQAPATE